MYVSYVSITYNALWIIIITCTVYDSMDVTSPLWAVDQAL